MSAREPTWRDLWAEAKRCDMVAVAERLDAKLKRAGADWRGPCPNGCAKTDGFVVSPKKGIFLCRPSGASGDIVDMVEHVRGQGKRNALEFVIGRSLPPSLSDDPPPPNDAAARAKKRQDDESSEERNARQRMDAQRLSDFRHREEEQRQIEEAKTKKNEEKIDAILERAVAALESDKGKAYFKARGLNPRPRLCRDIRFVPDLDYWGARANDDGAIVRLATLPAIIAVIRDVSGAIIGLSQTYLDPVEPRKWRPEGSPSNSPRKILREKKGGLIRLWQRPGERLAIGEGWETVLSWHQLGHGPEDITIAAAVDLGNLAGKATGAVPHPTLKDTDGKPQRMPNGEPDLDQPGFVLPEGVEQVWLLGDYDSEVFFTAAKMAVGTRRLMGKGQEVHVHFPPTVDFDWNDQLLKGDDSILEEPAPLPADATYTQKVAAFRHPTHMETGEEYWARVSFLFKLPPPIVKARGAQVVLVNGTDIEPERVNWLWRNGLQLGVLNLLAGRAGGGKSTIAVSWSATVTHGGKWPDGQECKPGRAVYWSGEDGVKDTLLPRFIAAGGDRSNISFVQGVRDGERKRPFDPAVDMPKLAEAVEKLGDVELITLDPIALMVKGRDSHKNVETRVGLQPFADLLAQTGAAGLGIHHFTKSTEGADPLERVTSSLAFGALPRCVWAAAKDLNVGEDPRRVLVRLKMSNGPDWGGFEYDLDRRALDGFPGIEAQRALWGDAVEGTARDLLEQLESKPDQESRAVAFLREMLKGGPELAAEVLAKGDAEGLSEWALRRALKKLHGSKEKVSFKGPWLWELPK